ncbi:MAG TPA: hypothetical protein VHO47_04860 [Candidatus Babeliales bacterium]|nr:hypothetical protein [Candidatus Babeliales bacterium]
MNFHATRSYAYALIATFSLNAKVADLRYIKNSLTHDQKAVVENIEVIDHNNLAHSLVKLLVTVPEAPVRPQLENYKKVKTTARMKNAEIMLNSNGAGGSHKDNLRTTEGSVSTEYDYARYKKDMDAFQEKAAVYHERYYLAMDILKNVKTQDLELLKKINETRPDLNLAQKKSSLVQFLKDAAYTAQVREGEARAEQKFETTSPRLESWYHYYTKCALAWGALAAVGVLGVVYGGQEVKVLSGAGVAVGTLGTIGTILTSNNHIHHYERRTENANQNIELIKKFENLQF